MIKLYSITLFALLILGLTGCSKENIEPDPGPITPPALQTTATLTATFGPISYAVTATDEEKQLLSVALFIQTANGEFFSFFSDEPAGSTQGFANLLIQDNKIITAKVTIEGQQDVNGKGILKIVGNYAENNLSSALKGVTAMSELTTIQHSLGGNPLQAPFITLYESDNNADNKKFEIVGGKYDYTFKSIPRLAARIDLPLTVTVTSDKNKAITGDDRFDYFRIVEARIVNAKSDSYLLPRTNDGDILNLPQTAEYLTSAPDGYTITFYAYEMRSGDAPLEVYIVYKTRKATDEAWVQQIRKVTVEVPVKGIERNSYYPVHTGGTLSTFEVSGVSDWDDGDDLGFG